MGSSLLPLPRGPRAALAGVFDFIERFYNTWRRHTTLGDMCVVDFEDRMRLLNSPSTQPGVAQCSGIPN